MDSKTLQVDTFQINTMNLRRYLMLAAIVFCSTFGDVFISRGMKQLGGMTLHRLPSLLFAVFNPWVALGTLLLVGFFWSYLSALSWADLSYVMPATAFGHVLTVVSAKIMLHEAIPLTRWMGVLLISLGVGVIARGPSLTLHSGSPSSRAAGSLEGSTLSSPSSSLEAQPLETSPLEPFGSNHP